MANEGISCTLVGSRNTNELKMNIETASYKLSADINELDNLSKQISLYGSCASAGEYPDCLDLIASCKVDVDSFISAVAPLSEGASWFKRLYGNEPGLMKVILKP